MSGDLDGAFEAFTGGGYVIACHGLIGVLEYNPVSEVGVITLGDHMQEVGEPVLSGGGFVYQWTCDVCGEEHEVG